jgi:hypothetical protein
VITPEQLTSGQIHQERRKTMIGKQANEALAIESTQIVKASYTILLNAPFTCTMKIKEKENGLKQMLHVMVNKKDNVAVKCLSNKYRIGIVDRNKSNVGKFLCCLAITANVSFHSWQWTRALSFSSVQQLEKLSRGFVQDFK